MQRARQNKAIDRCTYYLSGRAEVVSNTCRWLGHFTHQRPEAKLVSQYQDRLNFRYPGGQKISYATETIAYFITSLALSEKNAICSRAIVLGICNVQPKTRQCKTVILCGWPTDRALVHDAACFPMQGVLFRLRKYHE